MPQWPLDSGGGKDEHAGKYFQRGESKNVQRLEGKRAQEIGNSKKKGKEFVLKRGEVRTERPQEKNDLNGL